MIKDNYKVTLRIAQTELGKLLQERANLDKRIAQVRQDIGSLAQLAGVDLRHDEESDFFMKRFLFHLGLVDACREVLRASDEGLTAAEVKDGLIRIGYDVSAHNNILASIHTTLRRMEGFGEVETGAKDGLKTYRLLQPIGE